MAQKTDKIAEKHGEGSSSGIAAKAGAFKEYLEESKAEIKKVVWPTRKETLQMTAYVFAFVVVMALFLWLTDKTLEWVLYDLILGWRKS